MMSSTDRYHGEAYSAANKVPSVSQLLADQNEKASANAESQQQEFDERTALAAVKDDTAAPAMQEKEEIIKKVQETTKNSNPAKELELRGERTVLDPVTGLQVQISDAVYQDYSHYSREALDPSRTDVPGPSTTRPSTNDTSRTAPSPVKPGNILLHEFPTPIDSTALKTLLEEINRVTYYAILPLLVVYVCLAFGHGYARFFGMTFLIGGSIGALVASSGLDSKKVENELERIRLHQHRQRGQALSPPTAESTEWMNALISVVWTQLNPDMFIVLTDMIEDVLQQSLPAFVDAVKLTDFTLGRNALRIISMRGLPDHPSDKQYPREEWIDQNTGDLTNKVAGEKDEEDNDQSGSYVNLECSFAYSVPPQKGKQPNQNISLLVEFFVGAFDWMHIPVPIWIAVERIVGTVRLRAQIVSDPPFVRNLTITLMGVPDIEASAIPMTKLLPNVLDLPFVSGLVKSSIAAATTPYVAPKSLTLNLKQLLAGDGIKKDTAALGVFRITIHSAAGLSAQDANGFSDPYVVLSYAKFGRPLYSSRIIPRDLNPVWEETAFLLVSVDEIRADEKLSVQLWDSDKRSADDLVGRVELLSLTDLMKHPGEIFERNDPLQGFEEADKMSGVLSWSIAYYDKALLEQELKKEEGIDHSLPKELQHREELKVETKAVDSSEESSALTTPPSPRYPSGILSVIIHQINSLECQNLNPGATGKEREGQAGQDTDDAGSSQPPSAYCEILVNDDMVYKTRVKQYNPMPFFEAGTEIFVRDWKTTTVRIVVRDSRLREHDPILGIVELPLIELLTNSSQVTRLFAIQDGVGYGRLNLSVLFKSVKLDLPEQLRGWSTGTICVVDKVKVESMNDDSEFKLDGKKLVISTLEGSQKLGPGSDSRMGANGSSLEWEVDSHIRLPTYDRYASALFFDFKDSSISLGKTRECFAVVWLQALIDSRETSIRIPIICSKDISTLRHCFINEETAKHHDYTIVGYLSTTVVLDPGLDEDHETYANTQTKKHEYEAYDRVIGQAKDAEVNSHATDDGVIDRKEKQAIAKSHTKALESRNRGVNQFAFIRTVKWSKDGIKSRMTRLKDKITGTEVRDDPIASEGNL